MNPLLSVEEVEIRLAQIFGHVEQLALTNNTAVRTVFTMLYVGAIDNVNPVRPSTVAWMNDEFAGNHNPALRAKYYEAAMSGRTARDYLAAANSFDMQDTWFADNSREGIRDDCLRKALTPNGAALRDRTKPPTSSAGVWTLAPDFAKLFDPELAGNELGSAIEEWQETNLTKVGRARTEAARRIEDASSQVAVEMPDGGRLMLPPGESSQITRDVVELMAPRLLAHPAVLRVASSDVPVPADYADLDLDLSLLPDVVFVDLDQGDVWFVEVVATDGVVTEERRSRLIEWAIENDISAEQCRFVSAFSSRNASILRRRLSELALDSVVWVRNEPDAVIYLSELM